MTSADFIENMRQNGVMLIENSGAYREIPPNFLQTATAFCRSHRCSSVTYAIFDPQDGEHKELRILNCGYAE